MSDKPNETKPKGGEDTKPTVGANTMTQTPQSNTDGQTNSDVLPAYDLNLLKKKGLIIGEKLGSGNYGIVYKGEFDGKPLAVKIIDLTKTSKVYNEKFLPRELYAITKLSHPNIITVYKDQIYFIKKTRMYVCMELADGGDILGLIKDGALPESQVKNLYKGIADALRYIHENGFAHRDIKSENILLNKKRTVAKISDFGLSRTCFANETGEELLSETYCGTIDYMAPEVLKMKPYNAMISDVWSMGVVLYTMVNGSLPFHGKDLKEILELQLKKKIEYKPNLSDLCKDLIAHQLEPDIKQRYTMKQVFEDKWFE